MSNKFRETLGPLSAGMIDPPPEPRTYPARRMFMRRRQILWLQVRYQEVRKRRRKHH
jgi:hypothetical protein